MQKLEIGLSAWNVLKFGKRQQMHKPMCKNETTQCCIYMISAIWPEKKFKEEWLECDFNSINLSFIWLISLKNRLTVGDGLQDNHKKKALRTLQCVFFPERSVPKAAGSINHSSLAGGPH